MQKDFCLPESLTRRDSITSKALGGRSRGGTLLSMPVKPEDAPNDHSPCGAAIHFPANK